jgi:ribosomal protein S2
MVDTNSDPREVDYVIPANDDASKSIDKILSLVTDAVKDGLANRTSDKEVDAAEVFEYIRSCSYPNNKSNHLVGMARMLVNEFNSEVPENIDELQRTR